MVNIILFYVYLGSKVNIALANGSWTFNHLSKIWVFNTALGNVLDVLYPHVVPSFNQTSQFKPTSI